MEHQTDEGFRILMTTDVALVSNEHSCNHPRVHVSEISSKLFTWLVNKKLSATENDFGWLMGLLRSVLKLKRRRREEVLSDPAP